MTKILVHPQVERFVKRLAPEPRHRVRLAIKSLPAGEIKNLEGPLSGYSRLKIGGFRIIYFDGTVKGVRTIHCLYAERRAVVYELFEQILASQAATGD